MRRVLYGLVVCCILTSGCIASGPSGAGVSPTAMTSLSETPTATQSATPTPTVEPTPRSDPTPVADLASAGTECNEVSVSFWGLNEESFWTQDTVRAGYYLPANTSILLVTFVDGTVQGVSFQNNPSDDGINSDGAKLDLETSLSETHVIRTVVYQDTNGDRQFEKGVDMPCHDDGEVVQAGPARVNFSRFG